MTVTIWKCSPCRGTGVRPQYGHVNDGKCFHCNGLGKVQVARRVKRQGNLSVDEINELLSVGKIGRV